MPPLLPVPPLVVLGSVIGALALLAATAHLFHGSYTFKYGRPWFRLWIKAYMRFEWVVMRVLDKIGRSKLLQRSRFLREMYARLLGIVGDGEIYTLEECLAIVDRIYARLPHVYVGLRICPCRQAREIFDDPRSKVTDLTFVYSDQPQTRMKFTRWVTLPEAKAILRRLDAEGYVHAMFGGCARWVDGSVNLSICNCHRRHCIPLSLHLEYGSFHLHPPHNVAVVDATACAGTDRCGECLTVCQFDARGVDPATGTGTVDATRCFGCGLCATHCPEGAISMRFLPENRVMFYENLFRHVRELAL